MDFGCPSCASCCRAPDYGAHDYCLPCDTNPSCPRSIAMEANWAQRDRDRDRVTRDYTSSSSAYTSFPIRGGQSQKSTSQQTTSKKTSSQKNTSQKTANTTSKTGTDDKKGGSASKKK